MTNITFHATYFEGSDGWTLGIVDELSEALTQGKDLDDTRSRLREVVRVLLYMHKELPWLKEIAGDCPVLSRELIVVDDSEPLPAGVPPSHDLFLNDAHDAFLPLLYLPPDHLTFINDMQAAGLPVRILDARSRYAPVFYYGPCVQVTDRMAVQDVVRATRIRVQWHYVANDETRGAVVHPAVNNVPIRRLRVPSASSTEHIVDVREPEGKPPAARSQTTHTDITAFEIEE